MVVYYSPTGSRWHITPLCSGLNPDYHTLSFDMAWENGLRCCKRCAELAYHGRLMEYPHGEGTVEGSSWQGSKGRRWKKW